MTYGGNVEFDWQSKARGIARLSIRQPVAGWAALDGSEGKRRDPEREELIEPWPYPWAGVLIEIHADGLRATFYAIDVAGSRMFVNKYDEGVRVLKDSGPSLEP